jgi:hypothetical protein
MQSTIVKGSIPDWFVPKHTFIQVGPFELLAKDIDKWRTKAEGRQISTGRFELFQQSTQVHSHHTQSKRSIIYRPWSSRCRSKCQVHSVHANLGKVRVQHVVHIYFKGTGVT